MFKFSLIQSFSHVRFFATPWTAAHHAFLSITSSQTLLKLISGTWCEECSNYHTIALMSHASKVILKTLQARLQQHMNQEFPNVQAELRKGRGTRLTSVGPYKKQDNSSKTSTSASLTMLKPLTVWITTNSGKFLTRWEYLTILHVS